MRITAFMAGVFLCAFFVHANTKSAYAAPAGALAFNEPTSIFDELQSIKVQKDEPEKDSSKETEEVPLKTIEKKERIPIVYTVKSGDSLISIANEHDVDWQRVFDKNTAIESPDMIRPGDEITIPFNDEVLESRKVATAEPEPVIATTTSTTVQNASFNYGSASSSGNTYYKGYCTWYAKEMRPDLPNNLGNADTWVSRAAAQGYATGSAPQVGAIGQQGMHVVYVESVNGDGTVTISEMNYEGFGVVSSRTVAASNFTYIY